MKGSLLTPEHTRAKKPEDFHTRELRNSKNDLAVPLMQTARGQRAFFYRGTNVRNKFNNNIKEAPSVYSFRLDQG